MKTIGDIIHQKTFPLYLIDSNGNIIYAENSYGDWRKVEYNDTDNEHYYEYSDGVIMDSR